MESILSNLFTQQEPNSTFKLKSYDQVMSESTNGLEEENSRDLLKKSYMSVYTCLLYTSDAADE